MCSQEGRPWNNPHPSEYLDSGWCLPLTVSLHRGSFAWGAPGPSTQYQGVLTAPPNPSPPPPLETVWIFVKNGLWVTFLYKTWGQPSHSPTPGCHSTARSMSYSGSKPIPMFRLQSILYALPLNYSLKKKNLRIPEMFLCPGTVQ